MTNHLASPEQDRIRAQSAKARRTRFWRKRASAFALLLSDTSAEYRPEIVHHERFDRPLVAEERGRVIAAASGLEFEVMGLIEGTWTSRAGETWEQVVARRWPD